MAEERTGVVTFKGGPLTLLGGEVATGGKAPDFKVLNGELGEVTLADSAGRVRLICVVPSLDTPVCDQQTRRFNEEASKLPDEVTVLTISCDLPFAQGRWCGAAAADKITALSDHRDTNFGLNWGVLIKELRLLARSVFVVDKSDNVVYAQVVPEVTDLPNFDAALEAVKNAAS